MSTRPDNNQFRYLCEARDDDQGPVSSVTGLCLGMPYKGKLFSGVPCVVIVTTESLSGDLPTGRVLAALS